MNLLNISKCLLLFFLSISFSAASTYTQHSKAKVRLLNKLTGKTAVVDLKTDSVNIFDDNLYTKLRVCYKSSLQDEPENKSFIQVVRLVDKSDTSEQINTINIPIPNDFVINISNKLSRVFIFSGWLFSSSPSVNSLEDHIYDITLLGCGN